MSSPKQPRPPIVRPDPKPPVRPLVTPPVRPIVRPPVTPPIVRPGPTRADDTGRVPPSERNTATRGGTPVTVRDAPGYRGMGTQTMPSSLPTGVKKGGVVTTRRISTAAKSNKKSNW